MKKLKIVKDILLDTYGISDTVRMEIEEAESIERCIEIVDKHTTMYPPVILAGKLMRIIDELILKK